VTRYASRTTVPVSQSRSEIEKTLKRYGAKQFVSGWDDESGEAMVGFSILSDDGVTPRQVRMRLLEPDSEGMTQKQHAQAVRSAWRSLALVVKAKLEAVESGISTVEREFLADVVLPNGQTLGDALAPQLSAAYQGGKMPKLLGGGK